MGLFGRGRPIDDTNDEPNPGAVLPSLQRIVDEGLLIAISAVRMVVKNDIIIGALREHTDFDAARYAATARAELNVLARQNEEYAGRVHERRKKLIRPRWSTDLTEDQRIDVSQFALRHKMHTRLALALDAVAGDGDHVDLIVRHAQRAASDEIRDAVTARLIRLAIDARDPHYEELRAARTAMLLLVDLALLRSAHATADEY